MKLKGARRGRTIPLLVFSFYLGGAAGWCLHASFTRGTKTVMVAPPGRIDATMPDEHIVPTKGDAAVAAQAQTSSSDQAVTSPPNEKELIWRADPVVDLRRRHLRLPVDEADPEHWKGAFGERRGGGGRAHEAVDILAPRDTLVRAVEDGTVAKLFQSKAGGTTVYQFDSSKRFCYYYAHLASYVRGLHEGQAVSAGQVLGYVGTSGNAPPNTPHLHFAIFELGPEARWWEGRPIDPYLVFRRETE